MNFKEGEESTEEEIIIHTDDYNKKPEQPADQSNFPPVSPISSRNAGEKQLLMQKLDPNSIRMVSVDRSGSTANIIKNADGSISTVRRYQSNTDLSIAVNRKMSTSSQPNIFSSAVATRVFDPNPLMGAQDALDRTKGKGDFYEHLWSLDAISENYECHLNLEHVKDSQGLTVERAETLLDDFGPNVLTPPPKVPLWLLFLLQFTNLLIILLMITACLTLILYGVNPSNPTNLYLGVLLWIVILLTCYETYSQEAKSDSLMEKFRALVPEAASVVRDGVTRPVQASELVPGDLIHLKSGDKIPADCRIVWSQSLKVDQASLTGESEPVDVSVDAKSQVALEAKNIIFNGSLVVDGSCMAVVIRTGDGTLIGKMVDLTSETGKSTSTLQADIVYFVRVLTLFALAQAVLIFIVGLSKGYNPMDVFVNGFVIIMIGNVPQGLPTTITACLWIVAERMGEHNVFVKKLDIIENLGSCTCICTDKTGTLTQNLMTVANTWYFSATLANKDFIELVKTETEASQFLPIQLRTLLEIATLNSRVAIEMKPSKEDVKVEKWTPTGDATELGLYRFCDAAVQAKTTNSMSIEEYRKANRKVHEIPFNSSNKWQMSIHAMGEQDNKQVMFVKGAPDVLLDKCSRYLAADGSIHPIDSEFNSAYTTVYEEFGGNGERVLGFSMLPLEVPFEESVAADENYEEELKSRLVGKAEGVQTIKNLIFVGLVTLRDPPREEVPQAIRECYEASVKVVMVTGDHPLTAEAIARNIGLITQPTQRSLAAARRVPIDQVSPTDPEIGAVVVRGVEISGSEHDKIPPMSEDDWKRLIAMKEIVFARTSPENKLTIVKEFTKAGHVTAMTGDGVNDSPALKQAAIGIAMGLNGSDVAKEAGNIILLDDNFASIVVGVREGRLLFSNLKKSIAYTLAHLTPEVIPVLLWAFAGVPQPMGSMLTLCIDLLTELAPASSLAYEHAEELIMKVPPRDVKRDVLTSFNLLFYAYVQAGFILTGGCLFTYFRTFQAYGISASDIFSMNNRYFPAASSTDIYVTSSGKTYDESEQLAILHELYSSWFIMIFVGQAAHIWVCRTTTVSIFVHGIFTNRHVNFAVIIAIALGCFVAYTPGITSIVQSGGPQSQLDILYAALFVSASLWGWTEGRKWVTRNRPQHWSNKCLAW